MCSLQVGLWSTVHSPLWLNFSIVWLNSAYSDDDDMSWKMRRTSAKLLSAIIGTIQDLLGQLYTNIAPSLINRFKEREETVRLKVLQTLIIYFASSKKHPLWSRVRD